MGESDAVIEVINVSKRFTLSQGRTGDLRERFARRAARPAPADTELWALKDISFTVAPGESLGIVGHNGSGKSTLLKMLTGILKPTQGDIRMHGRVGALIEVGAGFHPDLSGRENIFLNGSILGLSRLEIARKFDEIVSFAGLEKFIDTPVKRYSSGMYMRLGFAIAANTSPNILLIDEALAVGDTFFQRKCLRHLKEFVTKGGTVVFVSHAMGQVAELCEKCLWLDHGALRYQGRTDEAIDQYMAMVAEREDADFRRHHPEEWAVQEAEREAQEREERLRREEEEARRQAMEVEERSGEEERQAAWRNDPLRGRLRGLTLRDAEGRPATQFQAGQSLRVEIYYRFPRPLPNPAFCFEVFRKSDGLHLFTTSNFDHEMRFVSLPAEGMVAFDAPFLSLNEGEYTVRLRLYADWRTDNWDDALEDEMPDAITFSVFSGRFAHGCVYLPVEWESRAPSSASLHSMLPPGRKEAVV